MPDTKPTVIVVDDDVSVLRALGRLVCASGFEILLFDRPSAILKTDLPKRDACLVVDINLPEMNGVQLCGTLAASGCSLPFILMTAHTDDVTLNLALAANPIALLSKPFGKDLLLDSIGVALRSANFR